jgi:hypothetical protein
MLVTLLLLPLMYAAALFTLWINRRRESLGLSLALFGVTIAVGYWAILQSRSSTAAIGVIFLPILASASGALVLAYGALRRSQHALWRGLGLLALLAATAPAAIEINGARRTRELNARRDDDQARRDRTLAAYRVELDTLLDHAGDRADDTLDVLLRLRARDREFVLAALERDAISTTVLDSFARSKDLGIALQAMQNRKTSTAALVDVYRSSDYPAYFFQALAAHPNTPPQIMREIRGVRPAPILGLDIWFAGNEAAPGDILLDIARTSQSIDVIRVLLRNASLDCAELDAASNGPALAAHANDDDSIEQIRTRRPALCH